MRQATPATAREIAMFGHIAAAIRGAMAAKGMTHGDLNQALGRERGHTGVYHWINGKGGPGPDVKRKLAKVLDLPAEALERREAGQRVSVAADAPTALVRLPSPGAAVSTRVPEVLQFAVLADGTARLRLDLNVPAERGVSLLRLLLDAGLVVQGN
jgi:hypothetical protein